MTSRSFLRRVLVALYLTIAMACFGVLAAAPADAAAYNCSGRPATFILHTFSVKVPYELPVLRCGTNSYGYLHIKNRYDTDPLFEENIQNTLDYPITVVSSGTSATFWNYPEGCEPGNYFKVVVEYTRYSDGKPKGIITAYATYDSPPSVVARATPSRNC